MLHSISHKSVCAIFCARKHFTNRFQFFTMFQYCTTNLFTDKIQTQLYAKFRPSYTDDIFKRFIDFYQEEHCDFQLAVDVGCGSGQSTLPLAKHFKQVIGVDVSEQQLANAPRDVQNITFHISPAEELSFIRSSSVDLVTIAQALHWLDLKKFYAEVDRILKPGGSLIAYGYGICSLKPEEAEHIFSHIYHEVLPSFWAEGRKMVEEKYASIDLPYPGWIRDDSLNIVKKCSVSDFIGYMGSWSAINNYNKTNSGDILDQVQHKLNSCCAMTNSDTPITVTWPVFMLMGHKPRP
ncbi:unnamed protein product [Lymnaea stagnalis]|uniref:Methyltransferase type 11 domain-containing protein n=1 Tax=Lymnaea stagnalis TaxID=6523 RepID=A0AAV2II93_LYMST